MATPVSAFALSHNGLLTDETSCTAERSMMATSTSAVDASVMEADASCYHGKAPDEMGWSARERQTRAVGEIGHCADGQHLCDRAASSAIP